MVRASLRRGLAGAIVVCLVLASGPLLLAAGPPSFDHGLVSVWTWLLDELRTLLGVPEPAGGDPDANSDALRSNDDSGAASEGDRQSEGPGENPELGPTIDPDG